jgi:uncharacterized protein (TIGR00730 family)
MPAKIGDMHTVAVFCGSKSGSNDLFEMHARQIGTLIAGRGLAMVYGGGNKGLMGAVANSALAGGAPVTGVIPEGLRDREHHHSGLTQLHVVPDMHTRKRMMYELCEVAIILPGGFGTMDELFEMLTWNQLSIHNKPILLLNTTGYYTDLFQMMQTMQRHGFLWDKLEDRVQVFDVPEKLVDALGLLFAQ